MKRFQKRYILNILSLLHRRHLLFRKFIVEKKYPSAFGQLQECQQDMIHAGTIIESISGTNQLITFMEDYCEQVYQLSIELESANAAKAFIILEHSLVLIQNCVNNIELEKLEILFIPYKASMWTSLESIWLAAKKDEKCHAVVMPVPYVDIGDPGHLRKIYEGPLFPEYVPIQDYRKYSINKSHPDIIVIHNPYDETNNLTRVSPSYYTTELKKHTDCLVYSPYFSFGSYTPGHSDFQYLVPGTLNADKIILQSEKVKHIFEETYHFPSDKLLVTGSPKMDAIINISQKSISMPDGWKEKLENKTVFLLNVHLSYLPVSFNNTTATGNYALRYLNEILETILNKPDAALIWRPHPLLKDMLHNCFPECFKYVETFERRLQESDNCVIDTFSSYAYSFWYSDALISTWSSLINEYMATGKPVMIFQKQLSQEARKRAPLDRGLNYFRFGKNSINFDTFIHNVKNGIDPLYEKRMQMMKDAFLNLEDGTAGEKAYIKIKKYIEELEV